MADIFSGSTLTPSADTLCPRNPISFWYSLTLVGLSLRLAALSLSNTSCSLLVKSMNVSANTTMSSMYASTEDHVRPLRTIFMSLWNVAGELDNPIGKGLNLHCPLRVMKAVLSLSSIAKGTWKNEDLRSRIPKYEEVPKA